MPMREDCVHFQSRTYPGGETVRQCKLDLAPEAPWRCPDDCQAYERQMYDAGFTIGSLKRSEVEAEPEGQEIGELLDEAEDVVNAVWEEAVEEAVEKDRKTRRRGIWPFRRRQR